MESITLNRPVIVGVSGVKNSGKTTLITKLLPWLKEKGLRIATIKHDGHDFTPDVPGTDSFRHREAGAYGVGIYSPHRFMITKEVADMDEEQLCSFFPEADIILLEGFKWTSYPKIEVVRRGVSQEPVCKVETLLAVVSDLPLTLSVPLFGMEDIAGIGEVLLDFYRKSKEVSLHD